jgi:hypothetical protein
MRADIAPGGTFADYELTDHTETRRRLSELQETGPMILVLSRGAFCPKDHQQHIRRGAHYPGDRRRLHPALARLDGAGRRHRDRRLGRGPDRGRRRGRPGGPAPGRPQAVHSAADWTEASTMDGSNLIVIVMPIIISICLFTRLARPLVADGHCPGRPPDADPPARTQQRGRTPIRRDLSRAAVRFLPLMRPR